MFPRALRFFREVLALKFYTVAEVAKMLRVRKSFVYELVARGKLRAVRLSEKRIRVPEEALLELVREAGLGGRRGE